MKKLFLVLFLFTSLLSAQTLQLFWDLDGDKSPDINYTCENGDTITARLYLSNTDTSNVIADYPIYAFEVPVMYGYYNRWSTNENYSNMLTFNSVVFDTSAVLDSTGIFNFVHNPSFKRFILSYNDSTSSAIVADSCLAIFTFIVNKTGKQLLEFYYLGEENNYTTWYNTAVLDNKLINYSLQVRNCLITAE
jgi:hypothetical protein